MERQKKYWCFSCEKECPIIKAMEDGEEVYQCSFCKNSFVEEMEETNTPQNNTNSTNNINRINNLNNINIINFPQNNNINISSNVNSSQTNATNNNINQDEFGLDGTLLFLPSTVHYQRLNTNNIIPNILNSVGGIISNIAGPTISSLFSTSNNSNNILLSFLDNHNNDFQFNNLVNIIMSFESSLHGNPPASQRAMDNLPKIEVTQENINNYKDMTCNICLEGFQIGHILRVLECKHEFHERCNLA